MGNFWVWFKAQNRFTNTKLIEYQLFISDHFKLFSFSLGVRAFHHEPNG